MHALPNWVAAPTRQARPDGRHKKLLIVVPYRDREAHLAELLPALSAYFLRNGDPRLLPPPTICIVEQNDALPFNRGALCNIGFALHRNEFDYVCFHDVDCVPLEADYSYAEMPSRLIADGMRRQENPQLFFGAVVAFSKPDFERVNGFGNGYFGWGYEDTDLLLRIARHHMTLEARAGVYRSLQHAASELDDNAQIRPEVLANRALVHSRFAEPGDFWRHDGLTTLHYALLDTQQLPKTSTQSLDVVHHRISLKV